MFIKISGPDGIQKESMIALFKNSLLSKKFKISDNSYDIKILLEDKYIKITSQNKIDVKLNKPFSISDLLKITMDLSNTDIKQNIIDIQNITVDVKNSIAIKNGQHIELTEKEIQIILSLFHADNNILSKEDLLKNIWGYSDQIDTHTLESHIYKLRQKIEDNPKKPKIIITDKNAYKLIKDKK